MKKTAYPSRFLHNLVFAIDKFRDENHIAIFAHRTSSLITGRNIETILYKEGNKPKNSEVALNQLFRLDFAKRRCGKLVVPCVPLIF